MNAAKRTSVKTGGKPQTRTNLNTRPVTKPPKTAPPPKKK